eukprot:CAMPEP_0202704750 /NCGR_PEP_ID=MMETSP1385-20130828/17392_1 /ASSEMBLY_ACC=CAM_ASM_000861 /TAXON_ID=933848 /ORGANISM="Elphidium margaritaceum" /LENGTH=416 /DNA_ID=CAMNT_0049362847 /DNA_START=232 /DNA_END=1482 /DNA_ORIENTATION=-
MKHEENTPFSSSDLNTLTSANRNQGISRKRSLRDALQIDAQRNQMQHKMHRTQRHSYSHAAPSNSRYAICEKLGEGTYGEVYLAIDERTKELVAMKRVKSGLEQKQRQKQKRADNNNDNNNNQHKSPTQTLPNKMGFPITSVREIKILQNLHHDNILSLREVYRDQQSNVYLVFEYFDYDLAALMDVKMSASGNYFNVAEIKCIMDQLLSALKYAHEHFVVHRDLKLSNILYNRHGHIALCDWGLARMYSHPLQPLTPNVVTLWYRAPELLLGETRYHIAVDLWAIGCIIGELLLHRPLIPGHSELDQLQRIYDLLGVPNPHIWPNYQQLPMLQKKPFRQQMQNMQATAKYSKIDTVFVHFGPHCLELIKSLLAYDPSKRISAADAMEHPWFKEEPVKCHKFLLPTFPSMLHNKYT